MNRITKVFIIFILSFLLFSIFTPKISYAQTLFSDNFDDGDANGWIIPRLPCSGGPWQVQASKYGIVNPGCVTESVPSPLSITPGISYSFEVDMTLPDSISKDRNFVFKYKDSSNWYGIHIFENSVYLQKVFNGLEIGTPFWGGLYTSINPSGFQPNETYHFKIYVYPGQYDIEIDGVFLASVFDTDSARQFSNSSAGLQASGNDTVWFDNFVLTQITPLSTPSPSPSPTPTPTQSPTPSPTPTESPTPSPTPTPDPTFGPFDLPFNYSGRPSSNPSEFKSGFWGRMTATFDHVFKNGIFRPFTGDSYSSCLGPISCYDSHNGTDFSTLGGSDVYSVAGGTVSYASPHTFNTCTPERGGYGCVVIVQYPNNTFGLYAHLSKIFVLSDQPVTNSTLIGTMGNTGCPGCGLHLHFGVLKPVGTTALSAVKKMSRKDWQDLIYYAKPAPSQSSKAFCTYKSPGGVTFSFADASGWRGIGADPWSLSKNQGGCGITSPYLWKFDIGATP